MNVANRERAFVQCSKRTNNRSPTSSKQRCACWICAWSDVRTQCGTAASAIWLFARWRFIALFFTDFYLGGPDEESFRNQPFHVENRHIFRDYEELEDRVQVLLYDKPGIKAYCGHCRNKAAQVVAAETEDSLRAPCGFARKAFSRAELYVVNIRHIQHHAAQLSLRLRLTRRKAFPGLHRSGANHNH